MLSKVSGRKKFCWECGWSRMECSSWALLLNFAETHASSRPDRIVMSNTQLGRSVHSHTVPTCIPSRPRLTAQVLCHMHHCEAPPVRTQGLTRTRMQVQNLLRHWRHQSDRLSGDCRLCTRQLQHDHLQQPAAPRNPLARARKQSPHRLSAVSCSSAPSSDSGVVAGIPVSAANTTAGQSLWQTLQHQQPQFVSEVQKCLQELAAEGETSQEGHEEGILVSTRRRALLEDVLYYWAVAEAYLVEASLQASFR